MYKCEVDSKTYCNPTEQAVGFPECSVCHSCQEQWDPAQRYDPERERVGARTIIDGAFGIEYGYSLIPAREGSDYKKSDLLLGANPSFASSTFCLPIPKPIITHSHPTAVRPINTGAICSRERLVTVKS